MLDSVLIKMGLSQPFYRFLGGTADAAGDVSDYLPPVADSDPVYYGTGAARNGSRACSTAVPAGC